MEIELGQVSEYHILDETIILKSKIDVSELYSKFSIINMERIEKFGYIYYNNKLINFFYLKNITQLVESFNLISILIELITSDGLDDSILGGKYIIIPKIKLESSKTSLIINIFDTQMMRSKKLKRICKLNNSK